MLSMNNVHEAKACGGARVRLLAYFVPHNYWRPVLEVFERF